MKKDILCVSDLTAQEIKDLIARAIKIKREGRKSDTVLKGRVLGLLFDKPSTRTRLSFEVAMIRLGGSTIFMQSKETQLSRDESIKDTALVLSRYLDGIAVRTFSQEFVEEMARWATIPVINALTDRFHPCQILSDLMTVVEKKGRLEGLKIAWVGDGNNVANSWIQAAKILGLELWLACPKEYPPDKDLLSYATNIHVVESPQEAIMGADVVNTDVWVSMGQEKDQDEKVKAFLGFQLNRKLLGYAAPDAIVMHCLPAHRGMEITDEVMDGPQSVIFDQAENKVYMHQAILEHLLKDSLGGFSG